MTISPLSTIFEIGEITVVKSIEVCSWYASIAGSISRFPIPMDLDSGGAESEQNPVFN